VTEAWFLTHDFLFNGDRAGAANWTLDPVAQLTDVDLQFREGTTESVAMHAQLAGSAALVALVFLKDGQNKAFLEFPHTLGIKNIAPVHLQDECFQLIFHDAVLSLRKFVCCTAAYFGGEDGTTLNFCGA
jgi:hypothetical protein